MNTGPVEGNLDVVRNTWGTRLPVADTVVMVIAVTAVTETIWCGIGACAHARLELPTTRGRATFPSGPARPAAMDWNNVHIK